MTMTAVREPTKASATGHAQGGALAGTGTLEVEGEEIELLEGEAAFVPAGAEHRFTSYEQLSLLVVFAR
jgi:glyoxylate utilization-related uncharacterized protein